jgi:hypothetical protein
VNLPDPRAVALDLGRIIDTERPQPAAIPGLAFMPAPRAIALDLGRMIDTERPQPAAIPGLTFVPGKINGAPFTVEDALAPGDVTLSDMITDLLSKVQAEDARLRRMLPPAPRGMYWHGELQTREADYNFARNTADVVMRLVYRLFDERTGRPVEDPPLGPYGEATS